MVCPVSLDLPSTHSAPSQEGSADARVALEESGAGPRAASSTSWPPSPGLRHNFLPTASLAQQPREPWRRVRVPREADGPRCCVRPPAPGPGVSSSHPLSPALTYVQTNHRSNAPFTPRVLLLGPMGSGKRLQAALLAQKYGLVNGECPQLPRFQTRPRRLPAQAPLLDGGGEHETSIPSLSRPLL